MSNDISALELSDDDDEPAFGNARCTATSSTRGTATTTSSAASAPSRCRRCAPTNECSALAPQLANCFTAAAAAAAPANRHRQILPSARCRRHLRGPRLPPRATHSGPAGAIEEITERVTGWGGNGLDGPLPLAYSQAPKDYGNSGFVRSAAWIKLDELMREALEPEQPQPQPPTQSSIQQTTARMAFANRQTLRELRMHASLSNTGKPPGAAVRSQILCCVISSLEEEGGGAESCRATLMDESGEFEATLHASLFVEHPGCVCVGAAWALQKVGVLTLSPWSHHLVVTPQVAFKAVPPEPQHAPTPQPSQAETSSQPAAAAATSTSTGTGAGGCCSGGHILLGHLMLPPPPLRFGWVRVEPPWRGASRPHWPDDWLRAPRGARV